MNEFVLPSLNYFGEGAIVKCAHALKSKEKKKALIVTGGKIYELGLLKGLEACLAEHKIEFEIYHKVKENPNKNNVYEALSIFKESHCDCVIGVGGGSPNDCAKAVSILSENPGKLEDYVGLDQSKQKGCPLILINTTAGTASEISRAFLIGNPEKEEKMIFKDIHALADCTINDPTLMLGLPKGVTAGTGMDALTHAVESMVSKRRYGLTQILALDAIELIFENLPKALSMPENIRVREQMIYAQTLAGMAFCNSGVGLAHAISHQLSAIYDLPHGLSNAVLLPEVIAYNEERDEASARMYKKAFSRIAHTAVVKDVSINHFHEAVVLLSKEVGTFLRLGELGVLVSDFEKIAQKSLRDGNIFNNPILPQSSEIEMILKKIY